MALLHILQYPDERLRHVATPVASVDDGVRALVDDMLATMYEASGIGLAATQVAVDQRIAVIDVSPEHDTPQVFVNPEILERAGEQESEEGCLSIPGIVDKVPRAASVRVRALDRDGQPYELEADGLLATVIQHEIDHLDGRLFIDYLSMLKRRRLDKKLAKQRRREAADDHRALG